MPMNTVTSMPPRAAELIRLLGLQPHPEGGHYRELFRSTEPVQRASDGAMRCGLTTIDFLLTRGTFSAWHRVASDEVWHLLEGGALRLWLMPPALDRIEHVDLAPFDGVHGLRHVVPAQWWQAAEPLADYSLCGATVGPGFDFADFSFLRNAPQAMAALGAHEAALTRLA
jgi:uncharacterized protein